MAVDDTHAHNSYFTALSDLLINLLHIKTVVFCAAAFLCVLLFIYVLSTTHFREQQHHSHMHNWLTYTQLLYNLHKYVCSINSPPLSAASSDVIITCFRLIRCRLFSER